MRNNNKRILLIALVLAFSFTIFLGGSSTIGYAEEKFEVDVRIGFDGYVVPNGITPVRIEVKNNFEDIEGKVQLLFEDKFRGNQTSLYTAYSKKINIAKGSTKIINMESTFYQNGNLFFRVLDKKDNIVFEKRVQYLNLKKPDDLYVGVFSENTDSLRYLGKTYSKVSYGRGGSSYFKMLELDEHIPENHKVLKMFSTIVINNFDSEKLSNNQKDALQKWIESGGLLVIGTGSNYQKTLKGLNEELNFLDVKGTETINDSTLSNKDPLVLLNAELKSGEKLVINGEEILPIYHKEIGKGNVVITSFDLALSPFGNWDKNDEFMNEVINKYFNGKSDEFLSRNMKRNYSYRFDNIISYLPYNLLPSIKTIAVILILFILLVGPINYIILKKLDKREFIWLTIPLIVILFSGSIYVLGFKTRLRQPIVNNVSVINIDSKTNTANVDARSGLLGFKNGDWDVAFDKENEVFLTEKRDYDKLQRFANGEVVTEYIFDEKKHILLRKAGVLDVETVSNNYELQMKDKLSGKFNLVDGDIVGEISNLSDFDLEDAVVFFGSNYRKLGDIKSGDKSKEIKFDTSKVKAYTRRNWYDLFDSVYGTYHGRRNNNNEDLNDILNPNIKRDILDGVINSSLNSFNKNRFFMLAWNRDKIGNGIKINNKDAKSLDRNLIVLPLSIDYKKGDTVTVPYGILTPYMVDIYDMELEDEDQMLYGEGYAILGFKPEKNMELKSMEINYRINQYRGKHEMYIYNFTTEEWEKTDRSNVLIGASNKNDYYDSNAGTLLKMDPTDHNDLYVPNFTVEGVIK